MKKGILTILMTLTIFSAYADNPKVGVICIRKDGTAYVEVGLHWYEVLFDGHSPECPCTKQQEEEENYGSND